MLTESWQEVALLSIKDMTGTTAMNFALITESFEPKAGDKEIEQISTVSGGRITKWTPEGMTEFTAKIIPIGDGYVNQTSLEGFWGLFQAATTNPTAIPLDIQNTRNRKTWNLSCLWIQGGVTNFPANAFLASTASCDAHRFSIRNAYITANPMSFSTSDGLGADITVKCPAFTKAGASNVKVESTDAAGTLTAVTWV